MAESVSMALAELLRKADAEPDLDTLREGVRVMTQALMELEVAQHLGAERYQRSPERQGERNGYRDRNWDTRVGTLELHVPRVRDGSFFPGLLEPRKRAERALVATVREAYVQGVSTRRVDDPASTFVVIWAEAVNPFFSSAVRIQSDRGQRVITDGPYAFVRHPGYAAGAAFLVSSALALGSWLSMLPAIAFAVALIRRARMEDAFLERNLPGYKQYAERVRFACCPASGSSTTWRRTSPASCGR